MNKIGFSVFLILFSLLSFPAFGENLISPDEFEAAIDECVKTSEMDEFDNIEDVLVRMSNSCSLSGSFRRTAPVLPALGHQIVYDAESKSYIYVMFPDVRSTLLYGGGSSPYAKRFPPHNRKGLDKSVRKKLKKVWNSSFWLLPLIMKNDVTDTYEATNAYGAKVTVYRHRGDRVSLKVPINFQRPNIVAKFPMEAGKAREVSEHLGLEVDFTLKPPCDICFSGGMSEKGTTSTSFTSPIDIKLAHKWADAEITGFKLIDMRTGEILGNSPFFSYANF